ncbi:MAG TPA: cytochrome c oxidase subunit 4 [Anaerolineales bacterium]|jgi:cytochrome c oxidase subunit 1|nr:cytochrome c oxidase subunit 4 [Anaerolineales bacterium]
MKTDRQPTVHLPEPSYWPILLAFSVLLIATGLIFSWVISLVGIPLLLSTIVGWTLENRARSFAAEEIHE